MAQTLKIYIRNSLKYGKIINVPTQVSANQLYKLAAESQNLQVDSIHLILNGKILEKSVDQVPLKEKAIVHLINLQNVNVDTIEVNIKMLTSKKQPVKIQVESSTTIKDFIDDKLFKVFGEKSDKLLLVHIGRQLKLTSTFRQENIENLSELICVNLDQVKNRNVVQQAKQEKQEVIPIKDLEVPQEPKDIYPQPNFMISIPQEIDAKDNLDLIFDSKVKHASSLPHLGLEPEEIIPEEIGHKESEDYKDPEQSQKEVKDGVHHYTRVPPEEQNVSERIEASQQKTQQVVNNQTEEVLVQADTVKEPVQADVVKEPVKEQAVQKQEEESQGHSEIQNSTENP